MPSARITCPHCNANLRISTSGGAPTRAKCHTCHKTFTPNFNQPVAGSAIYLSADGATAPLMSMGPLPAPISAPPPEPLQQPVARLSPVPPVGQSPVARPAPVPSPAPPITPAAAAFAAPSPSGVAVEEPPARPAEVSRPEPKMVAAEPRPQPRPSTVLTAPPPPNLDKARHKDRDRSDPFGAPQLKPYEIAMALALVIAGLVGLGLLIYQNYYQKPKGVAAVEGNLPDDIPETDSPSAPSEDLTPKPWPPQLAGTWELRSDDGRAGRLILGPDGQLGASTSDDAGQDTGKSSSAKTPPGSRPSTARGAGFPDYEGHWYLLEESGPRYVLEFGRERRGLDAYKVTILLTAPDAFTLVETIRGGARTGDQHRFVRTGPAPATKAKDKAK